MTEKTISRVHYYAEQFLRTSDFIDEQGYHLAMRRRHNIAHHRWGIVYGLELVVENDTFFVQPGFAVDGYGRELVLPRKFQLADGAFDDKGRDALDVWLVYNRRLSDQAPKGYAGCGNGNSLYRWQENPVIRLDLPDAAAPERRKPRQVPQGDLQFDPRRTPPDDPLRQWPVFLGQIQRQRPDPTQPFEFRVDMADRPYAGLVGEGIFAPSGRARVQIGAEQEGDKRRFAVIVPGVDPDMPRLEIDKHGEVDIRGETTLHGKLKMQGGAIALRAGQAQSSQPWTIYRYRDLNAATDQLRIQMDGGGGGGNQVVVGYWSEDDGEFVECLVIDDNCSVTVRGNLFVGGHLDAQSGFVPADFTPEAQAFITASALSGISGASILAPQFYPSAPKSPAEQAGELLSSPEGLQALAAAMVADPQIMEGLLQAIINAQGGPMALVIALLAVAQDEFLEAVIDSLILGHWQVVDLALAQIRTLAERLVEDWNDLQEIVEAFMDAAPAAFVSLLVGQLLPDLIQAGNVSATQTEQIAELLVSEPASVGQVVQLVLADANALQQLVNLVVGDPAKLQELGQALGLLP